MLRVLSPLIRIVHVKVLLLRPHILCGHYLWASPICAHCYIAGSDHMAAVVGLDDYKSGSRGTLISVQIAVDSSMAENWYC